MQNRNEVNGALVKMDGQKGNMTKGKLKQRKRVEVKKKGEPFKSRGDG